MADNRNKHDHLTAFETNSDNDDFELLQNKFNAFLEPEDAALAAVNKPLDSTRSHENVDQFIDNIQNNLDALIAPHTSLSTEKTADAIPFSSQGEDLEFIHPVDQALIDTAHTQQKAMPTQAASKQPATKLPASSPSNPPLYRKIMSKTLITVSCTTAAVLWFFWPIDQLSLSQLVKQLQNDSINQTLPTTIQTETTTDKIVPVLKTNEPVRIMENRNAAAKAKQASKTAQVAMLTQQLTTQPDMAVAKADLVQPTTSTNALSVAVRIGNIRNAPNRSGKVLYKLVRGSNVTKLSVQGEWFQVRLKNGTVAWAHRSIF